MLILSLERAFTGGCNGFLQVTGSVIIAVWYLYCCGTWESRQGPGSCCTGCCTRGTVLCLSSTHRRQVCCAKGRKCLSEAVIHQILARIQKLTQKIVLPYLTYLSSVCVQVRSMQFTGEEKKLIPALFVKETLGSHSKLSIS